MIDTLLEWYDLKKRILPWRETKDPYLIWISEIIMQQTQIKQGLPYYNRFIETFPTVFELASASETDVLMVWQGLGYYSRARNMHKTAYYIANELNGIFPETYDGLLKLKGIGPYTAAAIASVCYNQQVLAVDGNIQRVMSRLFNINTPIDRNPAKALIATLGKDLIKSKQPGDVNQAFMDLGAMVCKPKQPDCNICCLNLKCVAYKIGSAGDLPVKSKSKSALNRYFYYLVVKQNRYTLITQRLNNDIWRGLYEFPMVEYETPLLPDQILKSDLFKRYIDTGDINFRIVEMPQHILSHQRIFSTFFVLELHELPEVENFKKVELDELGNYPFPRLIERFIDKYL